MDMVDEAVRLYELACERDEEGAYGEAEELAERALELLESSGEDCRADVVNVLCGMAGFAAGDSRFADAIEHAVRAVALWREICDELDTELARQLGMEALGWLGNSLREMGRYGEAEPVLREALALAESAPACGDDIARFANNLGVLFKYSGAFDEAAALYGRALDLIAAGEGLESHAAATLFHNLGGLEHSRGRFAEGLEPARRAYEIRRRLAGDDDPRTAADGAALGGVLDGLGRYAESRPLYEKALAVFGEMYGEEHFEIAANLNNLANVEVEEGNREEGEKLYRRALGIKERLLGAGHPDTALTRHNLGVLLGEMGRGEEALAVLTEAHAGFLESLGEAHPHTRACAVAIAELG